MTWLSVPTSRPAAYIDSKVSETTIPKTDVKSIQGQGPTRVGPTDGPEFVVGGVQYSRCAYLRGNVTLAVWGNKVAVVIDGQKVVRRPRLVKTNATHLALDEPSLARARAVAGLKDYVSNMTSERMGTAAIISFYCSMWRVEQPRCMSKHDPRAKPIFYRQRDVIEAYLTVVMTSLAVVHYLQNATGLPIGKVIHTLRPTRPPRSTSLGRL